MRSKIRGKLTKGKYNNLTERSLGVRALTVVGRAAGHSAARRVGNLKSGIEDGGQRDLDEQLVNATTTRLRNTPSWMRHGFKRWRHKRKWKKAWEKEWPRAKGYFRKIPKPPPPPRIRTKATRKRFKADMKQAWRSRSRPKHGQPDPIRWPGSFAAGRTTDLQTRSSRHQTPRKRGQASRTGRAARRSTWCTGSSTTCRPGSNPNIFTDRFSHPNNRRRGRRRSRRSRSDAPWNHGSPRRSDCTVRNPAIVHHRGRCRT